MKRLNHFYVQIFHLINSKRVRVMQQICLCMQGTFSSLVVCVQRQRKMGWFEFVRLEHGDIVTHQPPHYSADICPANFTLHVHIHAQITIKVYGSYDLKMFFSSKYKQFCHSLPHRVNLLPRALSVPIACACLPSPRLHLVLQMYLCTILLRHVGLQQTCGRLSVQECYSLQKPRALAKP